MPVRTSTAIHSATLEGGQRVLRDAQGQALAAVDLVVDARRAGSRLSPLHARPLGYGAIWGTVRWPSDTALPFNELRQRYQGASHMVGVLPVGRLPGEPDPRAALFWSMPASSLDGWAQSDVTAWQADALALWPELHPLITQITDTAADDPGPLCPWHAAPPV